MYALEFAAVSKSYGARTALHGIDLAVRSGTTVGLLGPNGAGKTTALRLLLGYTRPSGGSVRLHGHDPYAPRSRQGVGYLSEKLRLPARMRVRGFLRLHAELAGMRSTDATREIEASLVQVGLEDRADERLGDLSKGLAQRVGFAQALLGTPDLLLLDEPTSGLDPIGIRDARDWLVAARARGTTILVSSHILSEVERTCDHLVILDRGRVVASGPLDEVVHTGESLEDAFIRTVGR